MSAEFIGYTNVGFVEQPAGSEQCFTALISSVTGAALHVSQAALYKEGLVEENGGVGVFFGETEIEVDGTSVKVVPLETPEESSVLEKVIDEQLEDGNPVALLYKKTTKEVTDPEKNDYHWILLTGYVELDGEKGSIHVINPLIDPDHERPVPGEEAGYMTRNKLAELIAQSTDYENGAVGIFPHALVADMSPIPDSVK